MVERREQHGRPPNYRNGRAALSRHRRQRVWRPHIDGHRETWPLRSKRFQSGPWASIIREACELDERAIPERVEGGAGGCR
jgi:hypothetical protein